jgi:hypothetical protein
VVNDRQRIAGEKDARRSIEVGNVSGRMAGRGDDLEVVEEKLAVVDCLSGGYRSWHSLAEETLEKHENAGLGDLVAQPASRSSRARRASQPRFVSSMKEDRCVGERADRLGAGRMIVVPVRQQDSPN